MTVSSLRATITNQESIVAENAGQAGPLTSCGDLVTLPLWASVFSFVNGDENIAYSYASVS